MQKVMITEARIMVRDKISNRVERMSTPSLWKGSIPTLIEDGSEALKFESAVLLVGAGAGMSYLSPVHSE